MLTLLITALLVTARLTLLIATLLIALLTLLITALLIALLTRLVTARLTLLIATLLTRTVTARLTLLIALLTRLVTTLLTRLIALLTRLITAAAVVVRTIVGIGLLNVVRFSVDSIFSIALRFVVGCTLSVGVHARTLLIAALIGMRLIGTRLIAFAAIVGCRVRGVTSKIYFLVMGLFNRTAAYGRGPYTRAFRFLFCIHGYVFLTRCIISDVVGPLWF